ncbi:MAG: hypothetical protein EOP48_12070 [Sphingobacteriales bacterium]|nr:MAG: hypothetical protein EOP48_12070 [Sphingobacteriales bacterium]
MKNYLLTFLAVFAISSCDHFYFYDININDTKKYTINTDCGDLQITSTVTDFGPSCQLRIEFAADSLRKNYTIMPDKFRLYANSKLVPLKEAFTDNRKARFAIQGSFPDSLGTGLKIFVLANDAIMCNGQSLVTKDTLHFQLIPRK